MYSCIIFMHLFVRGLLDGKHYGWFGMLYCFHESRGFSNEVLMKPFCLTYILTSH